MPSTLPAAPVTTPATAAPVAPVVTPTAVAPTVPVTPVTPPAPVVTPAEAIGLVPSASPSDTAELSRLKAELEATKQKAALAQSALDAKNLADASELGKLVILKERADAEVQAQIKAAAEAQAQSAANLATVQAELNTKLTLMREQQLTSEIKAAAAAENAVNPDQVLQLISKDFKFNEQKQQYEGTIDKKPCTIAEYTKHYLAQPTSANLVAASVSPRASTGAPVNGVGAGSINLFGLEIPQGLDDDGGAFALAALGPMKTFFEQIPKAADPANLIKI